MSWEQAAQSSALDTWLHKQIKSPSHGIILAKLPVLLRHPELFIGDLLEHDITDLVVDQQLGFQPRYKDIGLEGDPSILTPAFALAALCYREGISLSAFSAWLNHPEVTLQWLLLPPLAWRSLGIKMERIPVDVLEALKGDVRLRTEPFAHWQGQLSILPRPELSRQNAEGPYINQEAIAALQQSGLGDALCAKSLFLQIAPTRLLTAAELKTLVATGLDLGSLPIPLAEPEEVEVYWLWKKEFHSQEHSLELALTSLNALMVQAICSPRFDLAHFEMIDHPKKASALLCVLEADPGRMRNAPAQVKRDKLQEDLGL